MTTAVTTTTVETTTPAPGVISFAKQEPGLLVTSDLERAIQECKAKVERISKECRAQNRKFRDIEFDIEYDRESCLHGLFPPASPYQPADVHRVTQIFDDPHFFAPSSKANTGDIQQGAIGDCWFLSALATAATAPGLIEKFCVARDERVGVYGFIFFRDNSWDVVIIDDMLYTRVPKYEELKPSEQELYHYDKEVYNKSARKGGQSLYFAKSGAAGETWVPLVEKAYAKAHGSYAALSGGQECQAIEDLTGGVSGILNSKDILCPDRFWHEELLRANKDRLFGCSFDSLDSSRNHRPDTMVQGLMGGHAYSVLRAVECRGKRFVVVRNPWGKSEWTGRWSDGSKEWTQEWLEVLPELGHQFGDDGQFVMEYKDWLDCFAQIDRTILFDADWMMSSQWLQVTTRPLPQAWAYGDVTFKFTLPAPSKTVIVLSQMDTRYYSDLKGRSSWSMDFALAKEGQNQVLAQSAHTIFYLRSVHLEMELEAGTYTVYVRLDQILDSIEVQGRETIDDWKLRKLSRMLTQRAHSQNIASNFKADDHEEHLPKSLDDLVEDDYKEYERRKGPDEGEVTVKYVEEVDEDGNVTTTKTTTIVKTEKTVALGAAKKPAAPAPAKAEESATPPAPAPEPTSVVELPKEKEKEVAPVPPVETPEETPKSNGAATPAAPNPPELHPPPPASSERERTPSRGARANPNPNPNPNPHRHAGDIDDPYPMPVPLPPVPLPSIATLPPLPGPGPGASQYRVDVPYDDPNSVFLGLKVYTHKDVPANIVGQLSARAGPGGRGAHSRSSTPPLPPPMGFSSLPPPSYPTPPMEGARP